MNLAEYLPSDFFTLLTSKLYDEIDGRGVTNGHGVSRRRDILLVLKDTIDAGKYQMGIRWRNSQELCRWLTQEDVERRNSQRTPGSVQSSGRVDTAAGARAVQKMYNLRHVIYRFIGFSETTQLKYLQRIFEIRYLTSRLLLHLDVR